MILPLKKTKLNFMMDNYLLNFFPSFFAYLILIFILLLLFHSKIEAAPSRANTTIQKSSNIFVSMIKFFFLKKTFLYTSLNA